MRAAITGIGAVTALGRGAARLWQAMADGEQGIRAIERFSTDGFDAKLAGVVPDRNHASFGQPGAQLWIDFAVDAAREAWAAAAPDVAPNRIGLVLGSSLGDHELPMHVVTERIGDAIAVRGPRLTVSTACTSSTNALGIALDLLEQDAIDVALAGGVDVLTPLVHAGFHRLGVLSAAPCAPFSTPSGTSLGEGAGFCVLERRARGIARHALLGYGLSSDAFHETGPDPSGKGIARAMRGALAHAQIGADEIDYVNVHGTGTIANDPAEWRAVRMVLGERADGIPVSASKSFLGHAQGAAGVLELIATLLSLEHGAIPPTRNFAGPRPNSPPDVVSGERPRRATVRRALCNSSGFGGANCAVVVGAAAELDTPIARATHRRVYVTGLGAAGVHRAQLPESNAVARLASGERGLDPMTRFLATAAELALLEAGVRVGGAMQDRSGLVVGTTRVSKESEDALLKSIDERGLHKLSATMWSRMVLNAPVGACAKTLVLKGALTTISAADASGLVAIAEAAHLLATRDDVDRVVAGGVEEQRTAPNPPTQPGAVAALLTVEPPVHGPRIRIAGWSVAGPDHASVACRMALAMAGEAVDVVIGRAVAEANGARVIVPELRAGAASSALGFALAIAALREGTARSALIVAEPNESASCAVVVVREGSTL